MGVVDTRRKVGLVRMCDILLYLFCILLEY